MRILPSWSGSKPERQPSLYCHPWYSHELPGSEEGPGCLMLLLSHLMWAVFFQLASSLPGCPWTTAVLTLFREWTELSGAVLRGRLDTKYSHKASKEKEAERADCTAPRCGARAAAQTSLSGESSQYRGTWA